MGLRDLLINIKTEVYSEITYHSGAISFYTEDAKDTAKIVLAGFGANNGNSI